MQVEFPREMMGGVRGDLDRLWEDVWRIVEYLRVTEEALRAGSAEIVKIDQAVVPDYGGRIAAIEAQLSSVVATRIPIGQLDNTSTSTVMTATISGITSLADGTAAYIRNGVVTSASGVTLNVNGLGAKPIYNTLSNAVISSTFGVNSTMLFIYNSTRVAGGCWDMYYGYNSNDNTLAYQLRTERTSRPLTDRLSRYLFCFSQPDGTLVPCYTVSSGNGTTATTKTLNTSRAFDPRMPIFYYGATTNIPNTAQPGGSTLFRAYHACEMRYAWNTGTTLQAVKPCYVRCTPQNGGMVKLDGNDCLVQDLPTTEDGKVYIYLGQAYGSTGYNIELDTEHPCFEYKSGIGIVTWIPEIIV